ncbi:hypothetical protein CK203_097954 [Vitis vinifera]|uniref:Uncharacterized protein n=1 Tax=Vitis vinifera TaxID=29760 RepID=A0A438DQC6_VITVI|nr:hypothetical protein CK203_097954 [Vitis vinifera]
MLRKGFQKSESHFAAPSSSSPSHAVRSPVVFSVSNAGQRSISPKWHEREEQNLHLLRTAKGVCERSQVQALFQNLLQPSPSRPQPSPVKPAPPKPPARRYLTRSGVPSPVPSPIPSPEATPIPSPVPSPAPQEKAQEPQAPIPEPQIAAEAPLEEVIEGHAAPAPNRRKLDCRTRAFHSELCFDLATFRVRPELAQSFQLLRRYHMEHLLAPRDFFYPRVVTDFYQTMTTKEPTQFDNFKAWTNPTELEMVSTLSRGAANRSHLLRGELPPVMFLIDAFLRHNIYPLQHWTQRRGVLLEALYKMSEGFFFGPHHLIMAALLYFEEKVHKKSFKEQIAFHSSSQGCYAKFWSISDTPLSLSRKEREYAPGQPQPAARRASPRHPPEGITLATPAIPRASPAAPAPSQPSTSAEPRMAIPISEYRELVPSIGDS